MSWLPLADVCEASLPGLTRQCPPPYPPPHAGEGREGDGPAGQSPNQVRGRGGRAKGGSTSSRCALDPIRDGDGGGSVGRALCNLVARGQACTARSWATCRGPQPSDPVGDPAWHRPQPLFPG